jgi:PncC family amidohydrolase
VLKAAHQTVALAESCTGGLVGQLITDEAGSSAYFLGGIVAYGDQAKRELLGVDADLIAMHGAVSGPVAEAMATGARSRFGATLAAAVTGIAGPASDGSSKPVGLTYVAVASERGVESWEHTFSGDRWSNRRQAAGEALRMLIGAARALSEAEVKSA